MKMKSFTYLLVGLFLSVSVFGQNQKTDDLIGKGLTWLRTQQNTTSGYWTGYSSDRVGATALALQAFLSAGYSPQNDLTVQKGVDYLLTQVQSNGGIYNWSSEAGYQCAMAITALRAAMTYNPPNSSAISTAIENAQDYYVNNQSSYGGWRYSPHSANDYDLSVSQWAILALEGVENTSLWNNVRDKLLHTYCRESNGGYSYRGGSSSGTMTCAGIWGELIAGGPQSNVDAAFNWLKNSYGGTAQGIVNGYNNSAWTLYYTYGLAKACALNGKNQLFGEDWYNLIYNNLDNLHQTAKDGENVPEIEYTLTDFSPGENPEMIPGVKFVEMEKPENSSKDDPMVYWKNNYSNYETNVLATSWALLSLQTGTVPPGSVLSISIADQGVPAECIDFTISNEFGSEAGVLMPNTIYNNIENSNWVATGQDFMEWEVDLDVAGSYSTEITNNCTEPKIMELCFRVYIEGMLVDEECFNEAKEYIVIPPLQSVGATAFINSIGGLNVLITNPPEVWPKMELSPNVVAYNPYEYSQTYDFSFDISETGDSSALINIDIFASDLIDQFGNIIPAGNFTFTPNHIDAILAGESATVQVSLTTPATLAFDPGIFQGLITVQSTKRTKAINFEIGSPAMTVTPLAETVPYTAGSGNFALAFSGQIGTDWTITSDAAWLSATPDMGDNDATITYNYQANMSAVERIGTFTITAPMAANTELTFVVTQAGTGSQADQAIELPMGWLGISSYIIPEDPALETVFADIEDDVAIMISMGGLYWPSQGINLIGDWDSYVGYKIKILQPTMLELFGFPAETTVDLPAGLSYMPVLSPVEISTDIFTEMGDDLLYAFNFQDQTVFWPEGGLNTIGTVEPGVGYLVNLINPVTVDFDMKGVVNSQPTPQFVNSSSWDDVVNTGNPHIISIEFNALKILESGDYIGVFGNNGNIAGITEYIGGNTNLQLIAYGDDITTSKKDGLADGEMMTFMVYKAKEDQVYQLEASFSNKFNNGMFEAAGLTMITDLKLGALGFGSQSSTQFSVYPNPTSGQLNITANSAYTIEIVNAAGQIAFKTTIEGDAIIDLSKLERGVYFMKASNEDNLMIEKLIIK